MPNSVELALEGAAQKSDLYKMRRWLSTSRHIAKSACEACRKAKAKCQETRPCTRCISRGLPCGDIPSSQLTIVHTIDTIDRPLMTLRDGVMLIHDDVVFRDQESKKLPVRALRMIWEWGFVAKDLEKMFKAMTPSLRSSFGRALGALETLAHHSMPSNVNEDFQPAISQASAEHSIWENSSIGYQCFTWDPIKNKRTSANCNQTMAGFFRLHREEGLARIAGNDARIPTTDLRFLCQFMEDMLRTGHSEGVLLRQTTKKTFDAMGRLSRISMTYAPVSAEEYDQAMSKAPDMCVPLLVSLFGSVSTGQDLLYDEQIGQRESIAQLAKTAQGRKILDHLAVLIEQKFAHIIQMADQLSIKQEVRSPYCFLPSNPWRDTSQSPVGSRTSLESDHSTPSPPPSAGSEWECIVEPPGASFVPLTYVKEQQDTSLYIPAVIPDGFDSLGHSFSQATAGWTDPNLDTFQFQPVQFNVVDFGFPAYSVSDGRSDKLNHVN
eukprot:749996-Hanusia_phi.AAC.2